MKTENVVATLLVAGSVGFLAYRRYQMKKQPQSVAQILTTAAPRPASEIVPSSYMQPQ